jgi:hypothetical protein
MKLDEIIGEGNRLGFVDKGNCDKVEKALKDAGLKFKLQQEMGFYYFYFDSVKEQKAAAKLVRPLVNMKLEVV